MHFFPAAAAAAAALHPPLQRIFPPTCCYLLLFAACLGGRGDVTPLRAATGRRVTGADVRRRQTRRRLMATLSLERASERRRLTGRPRSSLPLAHHRTKKKLSASFRNPLGDCCQPVCTEEFAVGGVVTPRD